MLACDAIILKPWFQDPHLEALVIESDMTDILLSWLTFTPSPGGRYVRFFRQHRYADIPHRCENPEHYGLLPTWAIRKG
jgi:hypothetical protein